MSGFNRAARRRADRERLREAQAPEPQIDSLMIEGAVFVNDRDLGPGMFGVGLVNEPDGVILSFINGPRERDDNVELVLTAEASIVLGQALIEFGAYHANAARREKASMN